MLGCVAALALLLLSSASSVLSGTPSPGCGKTPSVTGNRTTTVNNKSRWYMVRLPDNYDKNHPYRLIFTFHALAGEAGQVVAGTGGYLPWYGLPPYANDTLGAIFVAPNGLNNGWANQGGEDILLVDDIIRTVEDDLCVDQSLRFSTGFSYGAAMSYSVACSRAKDFRAVAALSGGVLSGCVGGNDPIAYYGEHGIGDTVLPISMGRQMRDTFVKNNGCAAQSPEEPQTGAGTHIKTEYKGCKEGYPVTWVAFDGPHTPQPKDAGATATFAADETWKFFAQFK